MGSMEIKIAGLDLRWTLQYALTYKDYLIEMGYQARLFDSCLGEGVLVVYSVRNFSKSEAAVVISRITGNIASEEGADDAEPKNPPS